MLEVPKLEDWKKGDFSKYPEFEKWINGGYATEVRSAKELLEGSLHPFACPPHCPPDCPRLSDSTYPDSD